MRVHGQLRNISSSGALVVSDEVPPINSFVIVQFPDEAGADARESSPLMRSAVPQARGSLPAEVVRVTRDGFALEWAEFSPTKVRSILRSLAGGEMAPRRSLHSGAE
jgi:hypothetical protein